MNKNAAHYINVAGVSIEDVFVVGSGSGRHNVAVATGHQHVSQ